MFHKRLAGLTLAVLSLTASAAVFAARPAAAFSDQMCPAPISVCMPTIAGDPSIVPSPNPCPEGYGCVCVPSCPECDDCAAQVCVPSPRECKTACDCDPGLGCFEGRCIAGFAPVFCCERDECPSFGVCQSESGEFKRCDHDNCRTPEVWLCPPTLGPDGAPTDEGACGNGRVCSCTASCQFCEDCGPGVCIPPDVPTPYRCETDANCADGDRCVCVSSCPGCDDCAMQVCVPDRCEDPMCERRLRVSTLKVKRVVRRASRCEAHDQCVRVDNSTQCQGACGAWVNRLYAEPVERIINRIDERICEGYQEDGCAYATPGCIAERGVCRRGRCRGVPTD